MRLETSNKVRDIADVNLFVFFRVQNKINMFHKSLIRIVKLKGNLIIETVHEILTPAKTTVFPSLLAEVRGWVLLKNFQKKRLYLLRYQ